MNDLERKIREHRDEFDSVEMPRIAAMWEKIKKQETEPEAQSGWKIHIGSNWRWTIAAAVALIGAMVLFWPQPPHTAVDYQLSDFYPEFAGKEREYRQLVAAKEKAIGLDNIDHRHFREIFEELALLEEIQAQNLRDLPEYYDNEQLVQTLIKYYEQRIRILERLALEIDKKKHYEERNREQEQRL